MKRGDRRLASAMATWVAVLLPWMLVLAAAAAVAGPESTTAASVRGAAASAVEDPSAFLARLDQMYKDARYAEASDAARTGLEQLDAMGRGTTADAVSVIDRLVENTLKLNAAGGQETFELAQRAVTQREASGGQRTAELARSLRNLSRVCAARNDVEEAQRLALASLEILESVHGPVHEDVAEVRRYIGQLYTRAGNFQAARQWLEEAVRILEVTPGPLSVPMADALQALGFCLGQMREGSAASSTLQRSIDVYSTTLGPDHPNVGRSLTLLGQVQRQAYDLESSRSNLMRALAILEAAYGLESPILTPVLNALGTTLSFLGEYSLAEEYFRRRMDIEARLPGGGAGPGMLAALNNLAFLHREMGDTEGALRLIDQAIELARELHGPYHHELSAAFGVKAGILVDTGNPEAALPLAEMALDIDTRVFGPDELPVAEALGGLAFVHVRLGDADAASRYAMQALDITERKLGANSLPMAEIRMHLSDAAHLRGELAIAIQYATQALTTFRAALGDDHIRVAEARLWVAALQAQAGDLTGSLEMALHGEAASREHLSLVTRALSESQSLKLAAKRDSGIDLLVTLALADPDSGSDVHTRVLDSIVRGRALTLDEMTNRHRVVADASDVHGRGLQRQFGEASRRLARLVVRGPGDEELAVYLQLLEQARQARLRAEQDLALYSADFRQDMEYRRIGVAEVMAAVPDDGALVAYVRYAPAKLRWAREAPASDVPEFNYAAFMLSTKADTPAIVDLGPTALIDDMVAAVRDAIAKEMLAGGRASKSGERSYRSSAEQLRQLVWDPVIARAGNPRRLFIVPDGALNLVNFAALPAGPASYLAETGLELHYLSAERDLATARVGQARHDLLALGAPDFEVPLPHSGPVADEEAPIAALAQADGATFRGMRSACGSFKSLRFERLEASGREVKDIVSIWERRPPGSATSTSMATVLTGAEASEAAFKRQASGKQVLHLATHGFFLGGDCGSAMEIDATSPSVTGENPLLLSGLVLAGANHRDAAGPDEDDGILTAEEIGTLDLQGTEWAVLSACDTGTGEVRAGEGVFGLQRAFRMAGARTTIMSLWPVEDEMARRWMNALYRHHFVEGRSTIESVNRAHLDLLAGRRANGLSTHPFYWAGFIASGDWR